MLKDDTVDALAYSLSFLNNRKRGNKMITIKDIMKSLDLEEKEVFKVKGVCNKRTFRFEEGCLKEPCFTKHGDKWSNCSPVLMDILNGKYTVEKLPWSPKYGDKCFTYSILFQLGKIPIVTAFYNSYTSDLRGTPVFKTKAEALEAGQEKAIEIDKILSSKEVKANRVDKDKLTRLLKSRIEGILNKVGEEYKGAVHDRVFEINHVLSLLGDTKLFEEYKETKQC